jgi:hypothetical protein
MSDQTLAALSAAMVVPRWRIGFLFGPLLIRHKQTDCRYRYGVTAITCQPLLVGRALHVSDIFDKIKTEFVKERLTQQKHRSS